MVSGWRKRFRCDDSRLSSEIHRSNQRALPSACRWRRTQVVGPLQRRRAVASHRSRGTANCLFDKSAGTNRRLGNGEPGAMKKLLNLLLVICIMLAQIAASRAQSEYVQPVPPPL